MSDIWTPGLAAGDQKEIRPFGKLAIEARKLGFKLGVNHDTVERTMQLRFLAITPRAKDVCRTAMDNPECDRLVVGVQYRDGDNPFVALLACWEAGIETVRSAL